MTTLDPKRQVLRDFADLLSYPAEDPIPLARRCRHRLGGPGARHLDDFVARAERAGPHGLEEIFSATFDLQPSCAPYVGHHLCGDGPQRGAFLARLAGVYREDGFADPAGGELPDHLSVVLRYLAAAPASEGRQALLQDGLRPALDRMLAALQDPDNAYRSVLAALREEVR